MNSELSEKILDCLKENNLTTKAVSIIVDSTVGTVGKYLKDLEEDGLIEKVSVSRINRWHLKKRN